jgi:hypothetical protein
VGYTDGVHADLDMKAIELAAKQKGGDKAKTDLQRKRSVGEALGIKRRSYTRGRFKQQWIAFLKSTVK